MTTTGIEPDLAELDEQGFTVLRGFMDTQTTARLRDHMDNLLPPIAPRGDKDAKRVQMLRHPIPGDIMAEVASYPRLLDAAARILHSEVDRLQMLEQVLIRTDPADPPFGPLGWHIDFAFPAHCYEARPRQTYYHMVHALADVAAGQAATRIVPGSHHLTYATTAKLNSKEQLDAMKANVIEAAGIDLEKAIEIPANEGDVLIFNPMCLHAGAPNVCDSPRYVYFASFMDKSADYLANHLREARYLPKGFPDTLRNPLPGNRRHLVDWL